MRLYFINSKEKKCGVYQYGLRLWDTIKKSELDISYFEIENETEFNNLDFKNVDIFSASEFLTANKYDNPISAAEIIDATIMYITIG